MGTKWEQSGNKVGTRTLKRDKNGNKVGTKWEQSGNKNPKVGQEWEWEQSGNKNPKVGQEWEQSRNKGGTRTLKRDKNGNKVANKVGTKWEQEL